MNAQDNGSTRRERRHFKTRPKTGRAHSASKWEDCPHFLALNLACAAGSI